MADPKEILFFRSEINQSLLLDSDSRVNLIANMEKLKQAYSKLNGINFFTEWQQLYNTISKAWQQPDGMPYFRLKEQDLNKLAFFLDFLAQFFLHNGSEEDNEYLKNVDEFFKQHKIQRGNTITDTKQLFKQAFNIEAG